MGLAGYGGGGMLGSNWPPSESAMMLSWRELVASGVAKICSYGGPLFFNH